MSRSDESPRFDVFLSCNGSDREPMRALARALRRIGVRVFLDEEIKRFTGISRTIAGALASSKALVAYYSAGYAVRAACQFELMTAFLAGQRENDPLRRVMVINPEPNNRHLAPAELADAFFARPATTNRALEELAREISEHVAAIPTSIGELGPLTRPGPRPADTFGFVGRYRELWDLHSGLSAPSFPLTHAWRSNAVVSVCGLPGAGKSALAAAYVTRFHSAYPAGAWWVSLAGNASSAADTYLSAFERSGRLCSPDRPGLLVVDDVPVNLDVLALDRHVARPGLRTVLVSNENLFESRMPVIELGSLTDDDAITILSRSRQPENDDEANVLSRVAHLLGHHAGALVSAADYLKDRQGLLSYAEYAKRIVGVTPSSTALIEPFLPLLDGLGPDERFVLRTMLMTNSLTIPARLLSRLGQLDPGPALSMLRRRMIANRSGAIWNFDPLSVAAFKHFGRVAKPSRKMLNTLAGAIIELMAEPDISDDEWCCLVDITNRRLPVEVRRSVRKDRISSAGIEKTWKICP